MKNNNAVAIAPEIHNILFEDERVRVLSVCLPVGAKAEMHWHPKNISYVLQGGKMRVTKPDQTMREVELRAGKVISGVEGEHAVENMGDSDIRTIQIEFLHG